MKLFLFLFVASFSGCLGNLGQLGRMLTCTTDSRVVKSVVDYVGYGCFCGFGGEGEPLDATDQCCQEHDYCYEQTDCNIQMYTALYDFETVNCGTSDPEIICKTEEEYGDENKASCKAYLCKCDAEISNCFARAASSYNMAYRRYDQSLCGGAGKNNTSFVQYVLFLVTLMIVNNC
ncbi:basic phospholipase A2 caudoxin-like [Saccoglossus kowalevskii]